MVPDMAVAKASLCQSFWRKSITAHVKAGRNEEALRSLRQMAANGVKPDKFACVSVLKACANTSELVMGKLLHCYMAELAHDLELVVGNSLINMYGKNGCLSDSHCVLNRMSNRDVVTWTSLIIAYAHHNHVFQVLFLLQDMFQAGIQPNRVTIVTILNLLGSKRFLIDGMCIHAFVAENSLDNEVVVGNCIISMYNKCSSLFDSQATLDTMAIRNDVSWNSMISAYAQQGYFSEAFTQLQKLREEDIPIDRVSFVSIFKGCSSFFRLLEGMIVHACMVEFGIPLDVVLSTSLVDMYGNCGSIDNARCVFDKMISRNVISWTSMITAYAKYGCFENTLKLLWDMVHNGIVPDNILFVELLEACACLWLGRIVHNYAIDWGFEVDMVLSTALINFYGKHSSVEDSKCLFNKMTKRNVVSWTAMIQAFSEHGYAKDAFQVFTYMQELGVKPNRVTCLSVLDACMCPSTSLDNGHIFHSLIVENEMEADTGLCNTLINMYNKHGMFEEATSLFDQMPERDAVSWTLLLTGHMESGQEVEVFECFKDMLQGGENLDSVGFSNLFDLCGKFAALEVGQVMHSYAIESIEELDADMSAALLNMYNKCGSLEDSYFVFDKMPEQGLILWSSLMAAFSQHGLGEKITHYMNMMQQGNIKPDGVTFVSILSACSHAALLEEGIDCFDAMNRVYEVIPNVEHYMCMVDLLGRIGLLNEAEMLVMEMPCQPNTVIWMSLLGSCRVHNVVDSGQHAADHVVELDPSHVAAHVVLSNIQMAIGNWRKAGFISKDHLDLEL